MNWEVTAKRNVSYHEEEETFRVVGPDIQWAINSAVQYLGAIKEDAAKWQIIKIKRL